MSGFKYAGIAVQGLMHEKCGLPCQDACIGMEGIEARCIVLADGAGSVPSSEIIADAVVKAIADLVGSHFDSLYEMDDSDLKQRIIYEAEQACSEEGEFKPDCTLLVSACSSDGRVLLMHIGDGCIFGTEDGEGMVISKPENGEAANMTYFLSGRTAFYHLRIYRSLPDNCTGVMLCSDGAEEALYDKANGTAAPAVKKIIGWMHEYNEETVQDVLERAVKDNIQKKTKDDISIIVMAVSSKKSKTDQQNS